VVEIATSPDAGAWTVRATPTFPVSVDEVEVLIGANQAGADFRFDDVNR
jgi:hypothetical protein